MVEARREREDPVDGDEAEARLEAGHAAAGSRNADRAAGVGAERAFGEPAGERGSGAAARAAGRPARKRGVRHDAVVQVLRGDAVGELVQVRLPRRAPARRFEQLHRSRGRHGHVVGEDRRAVRRPDAGGVEQILDGESAGRAAASSSVIQIPSTSEGVYERLGVCWGPAPSRGALAVNRARGTRPRPAPCRRRARRRARTAPRPRPCSCARARVPRPPRRPGSSGSLI